MTSRRDPLTVPDLRAYAHQWHAIADAAVLLFNSMTDDGFASARLDVALTAANQARSVALACDEQATKLEQLGGAA